MSLGKMGTFLASFQWEPLPLTWSHFHALGSESEQLCKVHLAWGTFHARLQPSSTKFQGIFLSVI